MHIDGYSSAQDARDKTRCTIVFTVECCDR